MAIRQYIDVTFARKTFALLILEDIFLRQYPRSCDYSFQVNIHDIDIDENLKVSIRLTVDEACKLRKRMNDIKNEFEVGYRNQLIKKINEIDSDLYRLGINVLEKFKEEK